MTRRSLARTLALLWAWIKAHPDAAVAYPATLAGILTDPELLGHLPVRWSHGLVVAGVTLRATGQLLRALRAITATPSTPSDAGGSNGTAS